MIVYSNSPTIIESDQQKVVVTNSNSEQFLNDMLKELKKMNLHMAFWDDEIIENTEVE